MERSAAQSAFRALLKQADPALNPDVDFTTLTPGSGKILMWKCKHGPDHIWPTSVIKRAKGTGCPFCLGHKVSVTNSLATLYPEVAKLFDSRRNGTTPDKVLASWHRKVWWKCDKNRTHRYEEWVHNRVKPGRGCPHCSGKVLSSKTDLTNYSHIAEQLATDLCGLTPKEVHAGSKDKLPWRCWRGHVWEATPQQRTQQDTGCPDCTLSGTSKIEIKLKYELARFMPVKDIRVIEVNGKKWRPDIVVPEWNLVIEYDGARYHRGKQKREVDIRKTHALESAGYTVIRVREHPLTQLGKHCVLVPAHDMLATAQIVLSKVYELFPDKVSGFSFVRYVTSDKPLAQKRAERHIATLAKPKKAAH